MVLLLVLDMEMQLLLLEIKKEELQQHMLLLKKNLLNLVDMVIM